MYSFSLLDWLFEKIEERREYRRASERERKIIDCVPKYCRTCEILGICRDEDNDWKCLHGCLLMQDEIDLYQK